MGMQIRVIKNARELKLQRDKQERERQGSIIREHLEREVNAKRTREVNAYRATLAVAFLGRRVTA